MMGVRRVCCLLLVGVCARKRCLTAGDWIYCPAKLGCLFGAPPLAAHVLCFVCVYDCGRYYFRLGIFMLCVCVGCKECERHTLLCTRGSVGNQRIFVIEFHRAFWICSPQRGARRLKNTIMSTQSSCTCRVCSHSPPHRRHLINSTVPERESRSRGSALIDSPVYPPRAECARRGGSELRPQGGKNVETSEQH